MLENLEVPDFSLPGTGNRTFRLADHRGRHVVIYFYPKDDTPGCTTEGAQFRDLFDEFRKAGCEIFGVSRDSLASHEKFKAKMAFPFDLLSDADEAACTMFDVIKMKNMYGKQVRGIERSTFLIDRTGVLRREWRGVKVPGHADAVLAAVREL
ncbi:MAG: redoxin domain-containing protein [Betaproteobacteria bacterium]|nr:redoxin domain-containing protein [Betaproteobacteria bacterium]